MASFCPNPGVPATRERERENYQSPACISKADCITRTLSGLLFPELLYDGQSKRLMVLSTISL